MDLSCGLDCGVSESVRLDLNACDGKEHSGDMNDYRNSG